MSVLLILLAITVNGPALNHGWIYVLCDGDSNTNTAGWESWAKLIPYEFDYLNTYNFMNVAYGGKGILDMVDEAPSNVDVWNSSPKISILLYGGNDQVSADSTYALVREYCEDRQAQGWYMIVMTSISHDADVVQATDSVVANWTDFADDIVLIHLDPNIGNASDVGNAVYWRDGGHITDVGQEIAKDSLYPHLNSAFNNLRRL